MSIRDVGLKILDKYRAKLDFQYDLRRYDVSLIVSKWSGSQIGEGTETTDIIPIGVGVVFDGYGKVTESYRPKVELLSQADVIASGGLYSNLDFKIGPFTPEFNVVPKYDEDGILIPQPIGVNPPYLIPDTNQYNQEVKYKLVGPGMEKGSYFKAIGHEFQANFRYYIILRKLQTS